MKLETTSSALDPGLSAGAAVRRVLRGLLEAIRANEKGAATGGDPEFLHDFRVAVRRTRTCLGQLKGVLGGEQVAGFREEFRWLGSVTGPARDLDVQLGQLDEYRNELPESVRGRLDPLERLLIRRKRAEQQRVARVLRSARYRKLIEGWNAWIDDRDESGAGPDAARPVREVASASIERRFARRLDRGRAIDPDSPAAALHRLRIDGKKLRYLLEFFRGLYPAAELDPLVRELKKLQDTLGALNDLSVQQESLERFARELHEAGQAGPDALLALGRLVERLHRRELRVRAGFFERFERFDDAANPERIARLTGPGAGPRS